MNELQKKSSGMDTLIGRGCTAVISPFLFICHMLLTLVVILFVSGCATEYVQDDGFIPDYQEALVERGPQKRRGSVGLDRVIPAPDPRLPVLKEDKEPGGRTVVELTLKNAVQRALANSPEIAVDSYEPSIAREEIGIAVAEFDVTAYGEFGYDKKDFNSNDISESGQSQSQNWEAGIRQKGTSGAEWSLAYGMTRSHDESFSRKFTTGHEPTVTFEVKQPLLRDAWFDVNLAPTRISKLNFRINLENFRKKAEDVSTQVISLYWDLFRAREDVRIQQDLLDRTTATLKKVEDRKNIDATVGDIKQAETSLKIRKGTLLRVQERVAGLQDRLVRLLADSQMNLIDHLEIVPVTAPASAASTLNETELIETALKKNAEISRAKLEIKVAEINAEVARRQQLPRLDLVGSAQLQGLSDSWHKAQEQIDSGDYQSYFVGVTFEYPFGNREKRSEYRLRKYEQQKAVSNLQNVSDQVAVVVKERVESVETAQWEVDIQRDAVSAAKIYLQSLEDLETVRKKLTPEFLLAKIAAQETLARAEKDEVRAVTEYNIALARLAQATGRALDLPYVQDAPLYKKEEAPVAATSTIVPEEQPSVRNEEGPLSGVRYSLFDKEKAASNNNNVLHSFRYALLDKKAPVHAEKVPFPQFRNRLFEKLFAQAPYRLVMR